jgi:hypothetical protein
MNIMKKIIAAGLIGSLFAFSLSAQTAPDATVNTDGSLTVGDVTIPVPEGTVNQDGSLTIGSTTIAAPDATVNSDGSLTVGAETYPVPALPHGGAFVVSWFGSDFYDYQPGVAADVNQWYFSFRFKNMFHFAADNWFYSQEFDAIMFWLPDSGNKSLDGGVWVYTSNLFNGQTEGTWVFISGINGFHDLRDQNEDGVLEIPDGDAGAQSIEGWLYVKNPSGYPSAGEGFFFFGEYPDGNWIWRAGDISNAQKLRDPA